MELRQVRYVLAVAEELHFGRAAERLHMTQPSLSRQVAALERELGVTFFRRTSRQVELTAAGREFVTGSEQLISDLSQTVRRSQDAAAGAQGHVTLGFVATAALDVIPRALARIRDERPAIVIDLVEAITERQLEGLSRGTIDIGIGRDAAPRDGTRVEAARREAIMVAMHDGHRLNGADQVRLAELADEPLVKLPRERAVVIDDLIHDLRQRGRARLPETLEATQYLTLLGLVGAGIGIALVPDSVRNLGIPGVHFAPLDEPDAVSVLTVAVRAADTDGVVDYVRRIVHEVCAETGDPTSAPG